MLILSYYVFISIVAFFPSVLHHNYACVSEFFRTYSIARYFRLLFKYSKTCLKHTPYIPETWTNGK